MKVVLALCPVWDSLTPNLALAFLKGSVQAASFGCKTIDFSVQFRPFMVSVFGDRKADEYVQEHERLYKDWARQIVQEKPDVVGFSLLGSNQFISSLVAGELKRLLPNVLIIGGGPTLTRENNNAIPEALKFCNYVVEGEGEQVLPEILQHYSEGKDITKLPQIWFKNDIGDVKYSGHAPLQDINRIAYPDFTDFDMALYPYSDRLPLLFSRGCILNCNYCENKWNHLTQRSREGQNVFDELKYHVKKYGIKGYMFNDDSLISYKTFKPLEEFCDLTISEGLIMPWNVYGTRVERKLTDAYVAKLRKSGLWRVSLGVESFSSRVQHDMGKSSRFDDADKTCRMFANQGIKTESWIIYGYPTESDSDFNETLQWLINNPEVLSHVTANTFGPNAKYLHDKPNVIAHLSSNHWHWSGPESTLEKRKERFLLLIEVLESIRKSRKGEFSFHVGDPLYVKYYASWSKSDKNKLLDSWADAEGKARELRGLRKLLNYFGVPSAKELPVLQAALPEEVSQPYDLDAVIASVSAQELRENLIKKMDEYIRKANTDENTSTEQLSLAVAKMDEVRRLVDGLVPDRHIYAMSLHAPTAGMLRDLQELSAIEISKRILAKQNLESVV